MAVYIAVPPQPPDNDLALVGMVAWVAFLVVGDVSLWIRRRRMVRPDYVALAVTLAAVVYGLLAPVRWARFTSLTLAVLSAAATLSLWAQRDLWAVRRPRPAPTAVLPGGPDGTADSQALTPHPASAHPNRRVLAPLALIVALVAGLWWRTDSVSRPLPRTSGPTHTVDALGNRNPLCQLGKTITVYDLRPPANSATILVESVVAHTAGNGPATPPAGRGEYEVATVSVTGHGGSFPYGPSLFTFMSNTGKTYTSADGNSAASGYGPALKLGILSKGQRVSGTVTFDVPSGGGRVQLTSEIEPGSLCDWLVGT